MAGAKRAKTVKFQGSDYSDEKLASMTTTAIAQLVMQVRGEIGGLQFALPAGAGRVNRMIYPPGVRWSTHIRQIAGGALCQRPHVGSCPRPGHVRYRDGCVAEFCRAAV